MVSDSASIRGSRVTRPRVLGWGCYSVRTASTTSTLFPSDEVVLTKTAFYFNISEEEVVAAGFPTDGTVRVQEGGYLASLGVYHQLHCLVRQLWHSSFVHN